MAFLGPRTEECGSDTPTGCVADGAGRSCDIAGNLFQEGTRNILLATLSIHTDDASRGNPGAAAFGYVIERDGQPALEEAGCLGRLTNNQAEYTALVRALERALRLGVDFRVVVHSDSELMVKQMRGEYRGNNEELRGLFERAKKLAAHFTGGVVFKHVRRALNARADALCNEALDSRPTSRSPIGKARHLGRKQRHR
jgi:ribonuclease HI